MTSTSRATNMQPSASQPVAVQSSSSARRLIGLAPSPAQALRLSRARGARAARRAAGHLATAAPREAFDEHGLDSPGGIHALNEDLARGMYHPYRATLNSEDASSSRHNAYHVDYAVHPTLKPRLPPVLPSATVAIDGSPHISQLDSRRKDLANFATGHVFRDLSPETSGFAGDRRDAAFVPHPDSGR
ncbi:hypothetical protein JL721_5013 [Aureococcus anophagefferens]|nr:hypothetical protein JL721_5013 [Aureococcus anophagefferens]